MSDLQLDRDVSLIISRLNKLPKEYAKERKKILRLAAKPVVKAIKSKVKVGSKPHRRYLKDGSLAAVYHPGNLRRSVRTLTFKKSKNVFVGPKLGKSGSSTGVFKGNKVDGYYGHFLEYGTIKQAPQPYMRPGFASSKSTAQKIIIKGSARILSKYAARYRAG